VRRGRTTQQLLVGGAAALLANRPGTCSATARSWPYRLVRTFAGSLRGIEAAKDSPA